MFVYSSHTPQVYHKKHPGIKLFLVLSLAFVLIESFCDFPGFDVRLIWISCFFSLFLSYLLPLFQQTTYEHPSTSAPFMPTFKVFNHPDAVPQISTTMFILPNYIVTEGNLQSNKNVTLSQQTSAAVENLSLTVTDATVSSMDQYSHESSSCLQCNFLGWPTATTGPPPASIEQKASTLRQNQSFKIPDNERKICQNDSFLWLGLRVGVM